MFDWIKAASIIRDRNVQDASAGLDGDETMTSGLIVNDGKIVRDSGDLTWRMSPDLYKHFQDGGKVLVRATTVNGHTVEFAIADWTRNNGGVCMTAAYSADGKHAAMVNMAAIVAAYVVGVIDKETTP